jgi:potassium-transporting ATPase potassium-binding subunit
MTPLAVVQIMVFFGLLVLIAKPLGTHMARVFAGEQTFLHPGLGWLERATYRALGIEPEENMKWTAYSVAMLMFSAASFLFSYVALRLQGILPLKVIKQLGTNGGGFFNANSAHPFENPSPLSNFFSLVLIWAIPAAITYTFGKMVGNTKQGWAIFGAMAALALAGMLVCTVAEQAGTPHLAQAHIETAATASQAGGNMEGKEVRFGINASALFATVTTGASCGAVNSMHDSYTPIGGLVPLFNMLTGEVIFGGVGAGLYGMLMFAVLAVFIAGLMVGRTPEYLGKKIEQFEVQMAMLAMLVLAASVLGFTAVSSVHGPAIASLNNSGPHGFSEIIYAYASATGNNGSAFAGITANTPWYNTTLGLSMLIGRFMLIALSILLAGLTLNLPARHCDPAAFRAIRCR